MVTETRTRARRRDRWVNWIVIGVVVVALVLGWVVKVLAETRTTLYETDQFRLSYPAGWIKAAAQPPVLLQVEKPATPARTTLTVQRLSLPSPEKPLNNAQFDVASERKLDNKRWADYRELAKEDVTIAGREALHVTFAYVETNPDPTRKKVPVVMLGEDYFFVEGGQVYVFTLTAAEGNYARAQEHLQGLIHSFQIK